MTMAECIWVNCGEEATGYHSCLQPGPKFPYCDDHVPPRSLADDDAAVERGAEQTYLEAGIEGRWDESIYQDRWRESFKRIVRAAEVNTE